MEQLKKRIKVLVIDDSALVREILAQGLGMDPEIEVVGVASNPYMARDKIVQLKPDVLTLDVEMPRMDGVEFLRRLMPQYPLPVVMVSALTGEGAKTTLEALEAGAVDYVTKPSSDIVRGLGSMMNKLREKVRMAATANLQEWKEKRPATVARLQTVSGAALAEATDKVIAIGASTGGTKAIRQIIQSFPVSMPGVVIVQHMPAGFTRHFADNLNNICAMEVLEASSHDRVVPGRVLIAPGGKHMTVRRSGGTFLLECKEGEKVNGHCPSVDVLFHSVARQVGSNAIGLVLTGMGQDGADGLLAMRKEGARTLAQDEATSVVFGMPRVAYERGGAEFLHPLNTIPQVIMNLLYGKIS